MRYLTLPLLAGCFYPADEDNYPTSLAKIECLRMEECNKGAFESDHDGDMEECIEDLEDAYQDLADIADAIPGCEFDEDDAEECLNERRTESCGDWYDGEPDECAKVYSCAPSWDF